MEQEKIKEIKKALECCTNLKEKCDNEKCYLFDKLEYHYCERQLKQDILTLINELESENKKLKQHKRELQGAQQDLRNRIAGLEKYIEGNEQDAKAFVNGWHKDLETELKQFAERLKEELGSRFNYIDSLIKSKIDETLKEFIDE